MRLAVSLGKMQAAIEALELPHIRRGDPDSLEAIGSYALEFARIIDEYFLVLGQELENNAPCKIGMKCFTNTFTRAVEGSADFEARRAADILREELAEEEWK
jgi:hypothetical protein